MRARIEQKGGSRENYLSSSPGVSIFSCPHLDIRAPSSWAFGLRELCHQLPWFSGLRAQSELHHRLSWASNLQTTDHGTSQSPWQYEPIPIINLLIYIYIYLPLVLFLWKTLTNMIINQHVLMNFTEFCIQELKDHIHLKHTRDIYKLDHAPGHKTISTLYKLCTNSLYCTDHIV